jgi:hypothetical protein
MCTPWEAECSLCAKCLSPPLPTHSHTSPLRRVRPVTELWTNYGDLFEIWFDGGYQADIGANLTHLLNTLQPSAAVFGGSGISPSALRWVGTESGMPQGALWSTGCGSNNGDPASSQWCPATCDTTLQNGDHWFYTPGDGIRSLQVPPRGGLGGGGVWGWGWGVGPPAPCPCVCRVGTCG